MFHPPFIVCDTFRQSNVGIIQYFCTSFKTQLSFYFNIYFTFCFFCPKVSAIRQKCCRIFGKSPLNPIHRLQKSVLFQECQAFFFAQLPDITRLQHSQSQAALRFPPEIDHRQSPGRHHTPDLMVFPFPHGDLTFPSSERAELCALAQGAIPQRDSL